MRGRGAFPRLCPAGSGRQKVTEPATSWSKGIE